MSRRDRHVVALQGRLGNQLFQLAFALWLVERTGLDVALDFSRLKRIDIEGPASMRSWIAEQPIAAGRRWPTPGGRFGPIGAWLRQAVGPGRVVMDDTSSGTVPEQPPPAWWIGYWQQVRFAEVSLSRFRQWFRVDEMPSDEVIRVHVRRGDFTRLGRNSPIDWYERAIDRARSATGVELVEFVSDDRSWCENKLVPRLSDAVVAPPGDATSDLVRLARARSLVCSDSTFSWWAAYLGDPVVVISETAPNLRDLVAELDDRQWLLVS